MAATTQAAEQALSLLPNEAQTVVRAFIQQTVTQAVEEALAQAAAAAADRDAVPAAAVPGAELQRQREAILKMAKQAPRYQGKTAEDAVDFLRALELKWFDAFGIADDRSRADALAYLLTGRAETWYLGLKERGLVPSRYERSGQEQGLKYVFLEQFNPPDISGKYRREFENLSQTGAVTTYTDRFRELCLRLSYDLDQWKHRYTDKLKLEVKNVVCISMITNPELNFEQVALLAKNVDEELYNLRRESRRTTNNRQYNTRNWSAQASQSAPIAGAAAPTNAAPMDLDSIAPNAVHPTMTRELKLQLIAEGKCFYCKQSGHKAYECPRKKRNAAAPNGRGQ